jgi:hypothetical protein
MGYTFVCDDCDRGFNHFPPFAGEFVDTFLRTRGGEFAEEFDEGEKVTICADCMAEVVL